VRHLELVWNPESQCKMKVNFSHIVIRLVRKSNFRTW
jgi:hypothetical protein